MTEKNRILLVGAGAVGVYFCGRLAQHGTDVSVVARSEFDAVSNSPKGYQVKSIKGDFNFKPSRILKKASEYPESPDFIVVALKVLPEIDVPELIRPAVGSNTAIVLMQNGVGIDEPLAEAFPDNEIIAASAYIGAKRSSTPGIHIHKGSGFLKTGIFPSGRSKKSAKFAKLFYEAGVECTETDNILQARWDKLLWNAAFNPLSVLGGGLDTQEIMTNRDTAELAQNLMEEIRKTALSEGIELSEKRISNQLNYTKNFPAFKTSMLQDFESGRPLEVDAILGNAVKIAVKNGISVPLIKTFFILLRERNRKNLEQDGK